MSENETEEEVKFRDADKICSDAINEKMEQIKGVMEGETR